MNKLLLSLSVFAATVAMAQAQTKVTGVAKNAATGEEVYNLTVRLDGGAVSDAAITDRIGYFQFVDIPDGTYKLQVYGVGYDPYEKEITVAGQKELDLGDIKLTFNPNTAEVGIITLTDDELSDDESTTASNSGLLQSSRDVFARVSAYELGSYWFKPRGLDNKYNDVHFNGVRMNKMDNGRATFNNWGGLNDVTRRPDELTYGIEPSKYAFGDLGGVTNFDTRPSTMRKGVSLAYSNTNRSYRNRVMATYNTGLMDNGWAFMVSGSRRWAEEGIIEGTFYDAYAYYLGVEKKFNEKHTLNFTSFGAPTRRSTGSPNTQEVVDMKGIYYNSYWGWQDGEKRNERVKKTFEPINMLTHHWNINNKSKLTTTVSYQFGKESGSRLDWFNANNPSPTYYRNMPSYKLYKVDGSAPTEADFAASNVLYNQWMNGEVSQLNWNNLYDANRKSSKDGHAIYWLTADVNEDRTATAYTNFQTELAPNIDLTLAASYQNTNSKLYREVQDLMGAEFVWNKDDFNTVVENGVSRFYRYNILDNRDESERDKIRKGEKQEYYYEINRDYADLFAQTKIKSKFLDVTIGMKAAMTKFYRDGKFQNEMYKDHSYGKSKTYDFLDFGVKSNFLVKLDGRNFIQANVMYQTEAPTSDEIFPNARLNDVTIDGIESAKIFSGDLSYILRAPRIKARATAYYTRTKDEIQKAFGYIDGGLDSQKRFFVSEVLNGVGKEYLGTEIAVEAQVLPVLTVSAVASIGQYVYKDNPDYYLYSDEFGKDGIPFKNFGTSYLKNYKVSSGPQSGFSLGAEYRDPKFWWIGVSGNLLTNNYASPAAYRRTASFLLDDNGVTDPTLTDEGLMRVLKQEKFSNEFMLNINMGKTFRIGKYSAGISGTINNVLNNKNYVTGGFEQMRIGNYANASNKYYQTMFGPKMFYGMGTTYFANIYFRF